jgi:hypothetical protein
MCLNASRPLTAGMPAFHFVPQPSFAADDADNADQNDYFYFLSASSAFICG